TFDNTPDNQNLITEGIKSAKAAYDRGEFSYCFRRSESNDSEYISVKNLLVCAQFLHLLKQITNLDFSTIVSCFCSCYRENNWLSIHSDQSRGKIAFVFN